MHLKPVIASASLLAGMLVVLTPSSAQAAPTRYEAENSPAACTGTIDSNWSGFSGNGFCNGNNATGAFAQFTVTASGSGTATLGVRFANGTTAVRPASLIVNGSTVQNPSFEATGGWSNWVTKTLTVSVNAGSNTIRLNPTSAAGLPNLDYLDFEVGGQPPTGSLPTSFQWRSSGPLIAPRSDATHNIRAVKDPSIVFHNGRYHVFASTTNQSGNYNMVYFNFTDFSQAGTAQHHYLDTRVGAGYRAAPHVFFFAPQQRWYLVYQTGDNAAYSTTTDISNPQSWTTPQVLYPGGMPQIIRDNMGGTWWVDFWVVCDTAMCYMFSSDGNGHLYRSETTVGEFPNGFRNTVIAMQDPNRFPLWEAANVYKVQGANQYLLIIEAANGRRWFRSWTAPAITGPWTPLADTETNPFARANNVTFDGPAWTQDISHGEMIRAGTDQTMVINPCDMRYIYQGVDPGATDSYNFLPWRLGLLTQTNSAC